MLLKEVSHRRRRAEQRTRLMRPVGDVRQHPVRDREVVLDHIALGDAAGKQDAVRMGDANARDLLGAVAHR